MRAPLADSAAAVTWALLLAVSSAQAAPTQSQASPAAAASVAAPNASARAAAERFRRGLELARGRDWNGALAEFQASRELLPTRVALLNAATCLRWLRRPADALELYRELERAFSKQLTPAEARQVEAAIAALETAVGALDVTSNVAGAVVSIDGRERGRTPLARPALAAAGLHVVRVAKQGYESFQAEVTVAGKQRRPLHAVLLRSSLAGAVRIEEANGAAATVMLDGDRVGSTPWQGMVRVGQHSVSLRGPGWLGTAPVAARVRTDRLTALTLTLAELDAEVRIEPEPVNARVDIDGISVGAGVWHGRLPSGAHQVEVYSEGHVASRQRIRFQSGAQTLRVSLDRDPLSPIWTARRGRLFFVELAGGAAFAPAFGGEADSSCGATVMFARENGGSTGPACRERSRPLGWSLLARLGYRVTNRLAVEVSAGYLDLKESMLRRRELNGEADPLTPSVKPRLATTNLRDQTRVAAPLAAIGALYQFFDRTPLVVRVAAGAAHATVRAAIAGDLRGPVPTDRGVSIYEGHLQLLEQPQHVWVPFTMLDVRFGYAISDRTTLDVGVATWLLFAPSYPRAGGAFPESEQRTVAMPDSSAGVRAGIVTLPRENAVGMSVVVSPTVGVRWNF